MTTIELQQLERNNPLAYAVMMYGLNPSDEWKDKIRTLYLDIPEDERYLCLGDQDLKDSEIKKILGHSQVNKILGI